MKRIITFILVVVALPVMAQWQNVAIEFDSLDRQYRIYVPSGLSDRPLSLVFGFHGLGGNMTAFSNLIAIDSIADNDNIIVVCPQGIDDSLLGFGPAWNAGASPATFDLELNKDIDDVGYIRFLIDKLSVEYAVNPDNVFAFGFSLGGFMTQKLALELNDKIKAFASVAGTIGNEILPIPDDKPGRPVSIAHFHGTSDLVVGYDDNFFGLNVEDMIQFWNTNNLGNFLPEHILLPDIKPDNLTVDYYKYTSDFNDSELVLYRVNNGGHEWLQKGINDISYTEEIWKFFKRDNTLSNRSFNNPEVDLIIYPNPSYGDAINIRLTGIESYGNNPLIVRIYDGIGNNIMEKQINLYSDECRIVTNGVLSKGIYWVEVMHTDFKVGKKWIVY
ncbi:T9SS type A sorting domain-containing protein [Flavobacterium cerinum]|uniref:T9SS type A sorting domain-containing protein n=1 Tax=Flavobacterium cerinum TaxID=2502784 RepID=A0ABY5IM35_9FLAO|nr:T9SS type A sorting domain-containing protein [Flavobacterium cerinum]UUC43905.1 hypothetical protein NOX80_09690 [Flavobacterium cerinum]